MPLGPFKDWNSCISAQKRKGYSDDASKGICGKIEQNTIQSRKGSATKYEDDGRLYIKAFLLSSDVNINRWGVAPSSLAKNIHSFIGKPLVLTQDFNHPLPPQEYRVSASVPLSDNDDHIPNNVTNVNDIVDHWLAFQESFRIGTIIDITEKAGTYYAIIEVTEDNAKEAFKQNELPLFVSPAIAQLDPHEPANFINNWTGIHLAIVSDPAYTIHKALITGKCGGDSERCLLQLRQASVQKYPDGNGCSFCRKKALDNYIAQVTQDFDTNVTGILHWASTYQDFINGSSHNLKAQTHNKLSTPESSTATAETPTTTTEVNTTLTHDTNQTNPSTIADQAKKVANLDKCVQVFAQHGINPEQAQQICQIAMETMTESSQTGNPAGNNQSNGPPMSGQFGSVQEIEKELEKKQATIEKLAEELKSYKKNVKTEAERIAELETQVQTFQLEKKHSILDKYLAAHIQDEAIRSEKVKKFAAKDLTVEDLREIYEDIPAKASATPAKTASVSEQKETPKGKVQLRTASTDESPQQNDTNNKSNKIKDTNSKLVSSFFANSGGN